MSNFIFIFQLKRSKRIQYKLLKLRGAEEFYDLHADPYESNNLLGGELSAEQLSAYETLQAEIARLRTSE